MLSYLMFVVSLVNQPGLVEKDMNAVLNDGGGTGGLVVKMGPVTNVRVANVRILPGPSERAAMDELPSIAPKGSLFESFSKSRVHAVHYGR